MTSHGGKRPGSGRRNEGRRHYVGIKLDDAEIETLDAQRGADTDAEVSRSEAIREGWLRGTGAQEETIMTTYFVAAQQGATRTPGMDCPHKHGTIIDAVRCLRAEREDTSVHRYISADDDRPLTPDEEDQVDEALDLIHATMKTTTYRINTGYLRGILEQRDALTGHATIDAALSALALAAGRDEGDAVTVAADGGTYAYWSQEDADGDPDGSMAVAVIEREGSSEDTSEEA